MNWMDNLVISFPARKQSTKGKFSSLFMNIENAEAATKYKLLTTVIIQFKVRNCVSLLFFFERRMILKKWICRLCT